MTSDVGGIPLPESFSGPCRRLRYHETNNSKVQRRRRQLTVAENPPRRTEGVQRQGDPVFPCSSRLGIELKTPGCLVQDPTTRLIGSREHAGGGHYS